VKEWGAFVDSFFAADFTVAFIGWAQSAGEPSLFLDPWLQSEGRANVSGYSNEEVDPLLAEALRATDPEARKELYTQVVDIAHDEALFVYLYSANELAAVRKSVKDYVHSPAVTDFTSVWIEESE
jgi:peptide/nickel transport system substrate-binding protein